MSATAPSPSPPTALDDALAWLALPSGEDPLRDLVPLRKCLRTLVAAEIPSSHKLRIFEVLEPRVRRTHLTVIPLLLDAVLPLSRPLCDITRAINQIHSLCADLLLIAATADDANQPARQHRTIEQICRSALIQLEQQLALALMAFGQPARGLWLRTDTAYRLFEAAADAECAGIFGRMLALASAQPESFTSRELAFLREVLIQLQKMASVSQQQPQGSNPFFWCDTAHDQSPVASSRQWPTPIPGLLYISFSPLLSALAGLLEQLETGTPAAQLGLPREANQPDYLNVLRRAQTLWLEPPKRHFPRRRQSHEVHMCIRLGELWRVLQEEQTNDQEISKWMVINKSPDGCSVEHISGNISGLIAGSALGMRETPNGPWSICLVRWIRSGASERVEIGIEFVAPNAQPVRVIGGASDEESVPGLLLPALPQIGRREALLIARGRHAQQHFNLVMEKKGKVMLTTCIPGPLIQQTSSVEIFEFERARLPG